MEISILLLLVGFFFILWLIARDDAKSQARFIAESCKAGRGRLEKLLRYSRFLHASPLNNKSLWLRRGFFKAVELMMDINEDSRILFTGAEKTIH